MFLASVHSIWKSPWTLREKRNATQLERRRKCGTFYVTQLNNVMIECKRTTETTIDPRIQRSHPKTGDRWEGSASRVHDRASLIPVIPSILPIQLFSLGCCQSSCCAALISFPSAQRLYLFLTSCRLTERQQRAAASDLWHRLLKAPVWRTLSPLWVSTLESAHISHM